MTIKVSKLPRLKPQVPLSHAYLTQVEPGLTHVTTSVLFVCRVQGVTITFAIDSKMAYKKFLLSTMFYNYCFHFKVIIWLCCVILSLSYQTCARSSLPL